MLSPEVVYAAKAPAPAYYLSSGARCPEWPSWARATTALVTLRALFVAAGLDRSKLGLPQWNPLGEIIHEGALVVIKPNWVLHQNGAGQSVECLVTHTSVIEAILHYVLKAQPGRVVIGDAPVQGCDFAALMKTCRVPETVEPFARHGLQVSIEDFRRTIRPERKLAGRVREDCRPSSEFILFDLGLESALEAITGSAADFRVTMYDPDLLHRTHQRGIHRYLIARDVIDADVVLNVPKLKTHKKSCITGSLKNLVGINGHKEYLPHHRKGGSGEGGDCYEGRSPMKRLVEDLLDATNRTRNPATQRILAQTVRLGMAIGRAVGENGNYEGSWHGNDTVWRTVLDLQRLLHYGRSDGTLADRAQRKVVTITDAIVAGQGEGPLSPAPANLGMMTLGANNAAIDWVHAVLMGLDPARVPLTREAFQPHRWGLADFRPSDIAVRVDGQPVPMEELFSRYGYAFRVPRGWEGHCEASARSPVHHSAGSLERRV